VLSETEIEFFNAQGYLAIPQVIDAAQIARLKDLSEAEFARIRAGQRSEWDLLEDPDYGPNAIFRLSRVMARHPEFQAVATCPTVAEAARGLLGPQAAVCVNRHNMMVVKAPHVGRQIDWHQDGVNWGSARMVSFMLFLDDASPENGCLEIIPGAHRRGLYKSVTNNAGGGMDLNDPAQAALVRQAVPLCVKAGAGLFFHSALPHFSKANTSERYRRNLTFAYIGNTEDFNREALAAGRSAIESLPLTAPQGQLV